MDRRRPDPGQAYDQADDEVQRRASGPGGSTSTSPRHKVSDGAMFCATASPPASTCPCRPGPGFWLASSTGVPIPASLSAEDAAQPTAHASAAAACRL